MCVSRLNDGFELKKKNTDMWQPYYVYNTVKPVYTRTCIERNIQSANYRMQNSYLISQAVASGSHRQLQCILT